MSDSMLYSTGEFAQLCGVKKQTLFHYDDIGLLRPVLIEDNGYRRYSHEQYQDFLLITCLKEAGMSLGDIKDYLNEEDAVKRQQTVQVHLAALDDRISYLMNVRKILTNSFTSAGNTVGTKEGNNDEIRLVNRGKAEFWSLGPLDSMDDKELVEVVARLVKQVEPCGVVLSSGDILSGVYDNQRYLLVQKGISVTPQIVSDLGLELFTRPRGRYGITDQQPGETPEDAYRRLVKSLEDFDERPGEYFYEEYPTASTRGTAPLQIAVQLIPNDPDANPMFH